MLWYGMRPNTTWRVLQDTIKEVKFADIKKDSKAVNDSMATKDVMLKKTALQLKKIAKGNVDWLKEITIY